MSALSTQLSSLNNDVQTLLEGWKSRLEGVLERLLQFESDHKEFSGWMNEVSSKLGHDEPARGTVEGVKLQIEGMEVSTCVYHVYMHTSTVYTMYIYNCILD